MGTPYRTLCGYQRTSALTYWYLWKLSSCVLGRVCASCTYVRCHPCVEAKMRLHSVRSLLAAAPACLFQIHISKKHIHTESIQLHRRLLSRIVGPIVVSVFLTKTKMISKPPGIRNARVLSLSLVTTSLARNKNHEKIKNRGPNRPIVCRPLLLYFARLQSGAGRSRDKKKA